MTNDFNMLPNGQTLAQLVASVDVTGLDVRFLRNVSDDDGETRFEECNFIDAEIATFYILAGDGEAYPIHDVDMTSPLWSDAMRETHSAIVRALVASCPINPSHVINPEALA